MLIFTTTSKKKFLSLEKKLSLSLVYVGDSKNSKVMIMRNILDTIEIFRSLGFTIHPGKFKFILTQ